MMFNGNNTFVLLSICWNAGAGHPFAEICNKTFVIPGNDDPEVFIGSCSPTIPHIVW